MHLRASERTHERGEHVTCWDEPKGEEEKFNFGDEREREEVFPSFLSF